MTQKHGRRYEHELVNGLDEITNEDVWVTTVGYSGNAAGDGCDVVVTVGVGDTYQYNIEAKKRQGESGKRISGVFSGSATDESGLEEVQRLIDTTPPWAKPMVALKMDHRKLIVLDARWIMSEVGGYEHDVPPTAQKRIEMLEPRLTPSNSISMIKPETTFWPSSRASPDDAVVLAEALGLSYEDTE